MITLEQFKLIFPKCKEPQTWLTAITEVLPQFGIESKNQIACFLAQCGHESGEFNTIVENLNYRAERLLVVFPKYFNATTASLYAGNPEKIANLIYAKRMGNGNEASGDGWKFRGKGIIQLTGKNNHLACSMALFGDDRLVTNPELLLTKENAVKSACWFWNSNHLNTYADTLDIVTLTKKINGGVIGIEQRTALLNKILQIIK